MKIYGKITGPLKNLLKNNAFAHNAATEQPFSNLKQAMCMTPILVVLYFTKPFVLECAASGTWLVVVLKQERMPFGFTSKQLCDMNLGKYTYGKEMMAILYAIDT